MAETVKTPWHIWVVGVVAILWNGFGCLDFTLTYAQGDAYLASMGMTEAQMAYFDAMPWWTHVAWAVGVWGGAIGGLLVLLRRRLALPVFIASFVGWLAGIIYAGLLSNGFEAMGAHWPMQIVIGAACVFFVWYAWAMRMRGILR